MARTGEFTLSAQYKLPFAKHITTAKALHGLQMTDLFRDFCALSQTNSFFVSTLLADIQNYKILDLEETLKIILVQPIHLVN